MTLRPVKPIIETKTKPIRRAPIPPPPKIAWLRIDQLAIDESYQRSLSENGLRLIRRLVEYWDWNCFKPLSVAPTADGRYEIIDGQHSAMAAATHGSIDMLPCIVLTTVTTAEKSAAFVGINRDRVPLTSFALYRAKLASGNEEAVAVDEALRSAGGQLLETLHYQADYEPGVVACISTLLQIVRRGGKVRLARLMKMAIAAKIGPVPSGLLKGLEEVIRSPDAPPDAELIAIMASMGGEEIIDRATERRRKGQALNTHDAVAQVLLAGVTKAAA